MKPHDRQLFEDNFSDALVIDIDLSREDGEVSLLVVADHVLEDQHHCQTYLVRFEHVRVFSLTRGDPTDGGMFRIANFTISEEQGPPGAGGGTELAIELVDGYPIDEDRASDVWLQIRCKGVAFDPVPHHVLDMVAPGWDKAESNALIRPGVLPWPPPSAAMRGRARAGESVTNP